MCIQFKDARTRIHKSVSCHQLHRRVEIKQKCCSSTSILAMLISNAFRISKGNISQYLIIRERVQSEHALLRRLFLKLKLKISISYQLNNSIILNYTLAIRIFLFDVNPLSLQIICFFTILVNIVFKIVYYLCSG